MRLPDLDVGLSGAHSLNCRRAAACDVTQLGDGTWELAQQQTASSVNEITNITDTSGPAWANAAYDAAGNMTSIPRPASPTGTYATVYDAWNRRVK